MSFKSTLEKMFMKEYSRENLLQYYHVRMFYALLTITFLVLVMLFFTQVRIKGAVFTLYLIAFLEVSIVGIFFLLYKGYRKLSGILFVSLVTLGIWGEMFIIPPLTAVSKLDSIVFVYVIMVFAPVVTEGITLIALYAVHFSLFVGFMFHLHEMHIISGHAFRDYAQDNALGFILITVFSYVIHDYTSKSQETMGRSNVKLKSSNEELEAAMEELEATNEELMATMQTLEETQGELQERNRYLKLLMDNIPLPVLVIRNKQVVYQNQLFQEMLGFSMEELNREQAFYCLFIPDAVLREKFGKTLDELIATSSDGDSFVVDSHLFVTRNNENLIMEVRGAVLAGEIVLAFNDMTELVNSRDFMVQTEKVMTLGGMSAGVAHEINNPLGIIMQSIEMIERRVDPGIKTNHDIAEKNSISLERMSAYLDERGINNYLQSIRKSSKRAAGMVKSLLDFSRKSDSQPEEVDMHQLLETSIDLVSRDFSLKKQYDFKRIKINRHYETSDMIFTCRPIEIEQVIVNLMKNAAQAMATIDDPGYKPEIELTTFRDEKGISVIIRDNGPGMEQSVLDNIFAPFYTTKDRETGTGLGLSVSRHIVETIHQGTLSAWSEPGTGTAFTLFFPVTMPRQL